MDGVALFDELAEIESAGVRALKCVGGVISAKGCNGMLGFKAGTNSGFPAGKTTLVTGYICELNR